jgi:hypothetical protein
VRLPQPDQRAASVFRFGNPGKPELPRQQLANGKEPLKAGLPARLSKASLREAALVQISTESVEKFVGNCSPNELNPLQPYQLCCLFKK